ncbi:MAG: response regulator transcription factor [Bacteroidia bacterium]|nr:response regulator transcription factor [Bacteroidia bacterium]
MTQKENAKILLAEDETNLGMLLRDYLTAKGFETRLCDNGQAAFDIFTQERFDLCLLDVMMPEKDGFTLAKEIRTINKNIPIIFLTAKSLAEDKIEGFNTGADDYLTKPFNMEELLMRIRAVLKRTSISTIEQKEEAVFTLGDYQFDSLKQELVLGNESRKLTSKESELLRLLCEKANNVLDRNYALKAIWQDDSYFNARSMDVYITKLRKYLKDDPRIQILNIHGKGFKLLAP